MNFASWLSSLNKVLRRQSLMATALLAVVNGTWGCNSAPSANKPPAEPLVIYCAASNQPVLEAVCRDYERDHGTPPQVQYGASQTLLAGLEVSGVGDLYLPADSSYLAAARERNLTAEEFPLASMGVVVAVARGNPKKITTWDDLLRPDVRVAQANPDAAAIGRLTKEALLKSGKWEALADHTTVYTTAVNEVANTVKVGAVDAGIVFDVVVRNYETLETVKLPELEGIQAHVVAAVLKSSRQPAEAAEFARYVSAPDKGLVRYREFGFTPLDK